MRPLTLTPPVPRRRTVVLAAVLLTAGSLSGCLRWDTPAPTHPVLDTAQAARQEAAITASRLAEASARVAGTDAAAAPVLGTIAGAARTQLERVGGVWVAWPDGAPTGVATPEPEPTTAPDVGDVADVAGLLAADRDARREDALTAGDPEDVALHAALAAARAAEDGALARATGRRPVEVTQPEADAVDQATPDSAEGPATELAPPVPVPAGAYPDEEAALRVLDAARDGAESAAARLEGDDRLLVAAAAAEARAAGQAQVDRGVRDVRRAAWAAGAPTDDPRADARAALLPLVDLEIAAAARTEGEERALHLDAALRAAERVGRLGGLGAMPALPGVAVD